MNEHQHNCNVAAERAKEALVIAERAHNKALNAHLAANEKLRKAIRDDPTSWYSTPGKTKKEPHAPEPQFSHSHQDRRSHPI